jgi:hypothetical protein
MATGVALGLEWPDRRARSAFGIGKMNCFDSSRRRFLNGYLGNCQPAVHWHVTDCVYQTCLSALVVAAFDLQKCCSIVI